MKALFKSIGLLVGIFCTDIAHAQTTPLTTGSSFITPYVTRNEYQNQLSKLATIDQVKQLISTIAAQTVTTADNLTATGSTISDALVLTSQNDSVTTVNAGTGVKLPDSSTGIVSLKIFNRGANPLNIYPASSSEQIESYGNGQPFVLSGPEVTMTRVSSTQWRISP